MKKNVNLFPKKIKKIRVRQKWKRQLLRFLLIMVLATAITMVGLSVYSNIFLSRANEELERTISSEKTKIENFRSIESKQVYLTNKLNSFEPLLKAQAKNQAIAETIFSILPNNTNLRGFEIEKGALSLSGSVPSFVVFNELLENIREGETSLKIIKADAKKISYSEKGGVSFNLILVLEGVEDNG